MQMALSKVTQQLFPLPASYCHILEREADSRNTRNVHTHLLLTTSNKLIVRMSNKVVSKQKYPPIVPSLTFTSSSSSSSSLFPSISTYRVELFALF
jgi:hypothetical protein